MTYATYAATPYLRRLTADNGWRGELVRDRNGDIDVILAVRVGSTFTDAVVIMAEDQVVALRQYTHGEGLVLPGPVWQRSGRCEDVLAALFDLPAG
ncbi:MAG: hypothetical protein GEU83_04125 [Pseudonocardiaceae bacterium]|nr:hypothetical protein [Pseudonocardiaceae bacterium]